MFCPAQEAASRSRLHVAFTRWLGQARSSRQAAAAAPQAPSGMFGSENVAPPARPPPSSSGGSSAGGAAQLAALAALGQGRKPSAAWAASRPQPLTALTGQRHPILSSGPASPASSVAGAPTHPRYGSLTTGLMSGATVGFGPSRLSATPPAAGALPGLTAGNPALNVATPTYSRPSGLQQPPAAYHPALQQQPYAYPMQRTSAPAQPSAAVPLAAQLRTASYVYAPQPRTPAAPQPQSYVPQSHPHLASPLAQASSSPQPAVRITPAASPLAVGSRAAPTTGSLLQGQSAWAHSAKQQQQQGRVSSLESLVAQHLVDALGGGSDAAFLAGLELATAGGLGPRDGASSASVAGPLTAGDVARGPGRASQQPATNGTSGRSINAASHASQARASVGVAGSGAGEVVGSQLAAPRSLYSSYTQAAAGAVQTSLGAVQYGRVRPGSAGSGSSSGRASRPAALAGSGVLFGAALEGGSVMDNIRAPPSSAGIDLQFYGVSKRQ